MRKLLIAGVAIAALSVTPTLADDAEAVVGGTAGAWTGGTIGFLLGGPIGAVIGGSTGAVIGASVLDDDASFGAGGDVEVTGSIGIGDYVDEGIRLRHIDGEDQYGYFRADGHVYVVDVDTREVVEIRLG